MYTNIAALAAVLASTVSAGEFVCEGPYFNFFNRGGNHMSYQRLDPAINPGTQSPHLHSFDGGNNLDATSSYSTMTSSTCTSARIKADKSLYWAPTLFWNGNGTGFHRVPNKGNKIYYKFGNGDGTKAQVSEFPEDFSMIAGDPYKRSDGDNPGRVRWGCHGNGQKFSNGFPTGITSCDYGLAAEVTFPSCWNGNKIDPKDPMAHVAWPTAGGKGIEACPETHREARFPEIFIEFWYDVKSFNGHYTADDNPWVLSQGDPTGFGFHADFLNGWEKGVLAKATADQGYCNCGCGCSDESMKVCFGAENVNTNNDEEFESCTATSTYSGDDALVFDKLPGCNPLQAGPARATPVTGEGCTSGGSGGSESAAPKPTSQAASSAQSQVPASSAQSGTPVSSVQPQMPASSVQSQASSSAVQSSASSMAGYSTSASVTSRRARSSHRAQVASTALPSLTVSIPNKQVAVDADLGGGYGEDYATPPVVTSVASSSSSYVVITTALSDAGTLGLVFDDIATDATISRPATPTGVDDVDFELPSTTASPVETPSSGDECKAPVYVTITPTVYVTLGADVNATSSCTPTVYETVTTKHTVTVTPSAAIGYKHRRHAHMHKH